MKKWFRLIGIVIATMVLMAISYVLYYFPPIMTGMDAKVMCSCVFVTGRTPESVKEKELQVFPGLTLADIKVDRADSSVTARLLWDESKAIFRKGLGCTLLKERSEKEVRDQPIRRPQLRDPRSLDTIAWPAGNKWDSTKVDGINYAALQQAIDNAFIETDPEKPINTHGVVIVYDGNIIAERYAPGVDQNSRLMGWSMTKSIGNALVGILVRDGVLNVQEPAPIPGWNDDERKNITINDLLHASSGLQWNESYFIPTSAFHNMFIRRDDKGGYAASLPLAHDPGSFFQYSSGSSNILSHIIRQKVGDDEYHRFPYERLFFKLSMYTAILEPDASGTFVQSSYCFASARDWARFGLLYLNNGVVNGERILPEGWVRYSTSPAPAAKKREYGAQIWLNLGRPDDPQDCFEPGVPHDAYFFEGFERNSVTVIPSRKLVAVRLGVTHNSNFKLGRFLSDVLAALPTDGPVAQE